MLHDLSSTLAQTLGSRPGMVYVAAVFGLLGAMFLLRRIPPIFFFTVLPATALHELMHLIAATTLNGQPAGFSIVPRRRDNGYVLGSVQCANIRWYNGLFIGLAPLVLLPAALALLLWRLHAQADRQPIELFWAYAVACLLYGAAPSWQDIRTAFVASWFPLLAASGGIALWWSGWLPL